MKLYRKETNCRIKHMLTMPKYLKLVILGLVVVTVTSCRTSPTQEGVTIDLSAKWDGFDNGETVQLHAKVTSESNKELIITEGEYGFRLIVDGDEYLWSPKTWEVDYPYMRINKGDLHTVRITIDKDEWRSIKDGRKFLELNPGRHRIQSIAIPHPSSEFKKEIYSNTIGFMIKSDTPAMQVGGGRRIK